MMWACLGLFLQTIILLDFLWKKGEKYNREECGLRPHVYTGRNNLVVGGKNNT